MELILIFHMIVLIFGTGSPTCVPNSQLQAAAILGETVGFGTGGGGHGGHRPGRSLPGNLDCRSQQIDLLPVHVLHVVLSHIKARNVRKYSARAEARKIHTYVILLWIDCGVRQQKCLDTVRVHRLPHTPISRGQLMAHSRLASARELWTKNKLKHYSISIPVSHNPSPDPPLRVRISGKKGGKK